MNLTRSHSPPGRTRRRRTDRAASLVEYAMLVALIAFACIGAITYFGGSSGNSVSNSADSIINAG